jgi:hypothetical protein
VGTSPGKRREFFLGWRGADGCGVVGGEEDGSLLLGELRICACGEG